jgi:hypothetical protein
VQWQQHCAHGNSRAGAWLSSRHSVHVYYTTDIYGSKFLLILESVSLTSGPTQRAN